MARGKRNAEPVLNGTEYSVEHVVKLLNKESETDFSIMSEGRFDAEPKIWFSSGLTLLDLIIRGGIPIGRFVEIYGKESSGKSLLLMSIMAQAQQRGYWTILDDVEMAYSTDFAGRLGGVDLSKLIYFSSKKKNEKGEDRTLSLEEHLDNNEKIIRGIRAVDPITPIILGIDSMAALATKAELSNLLSKEQAMAAAARKISAWYRKSVGLVSELNATVIVTNQLREKIGTMPGQDSDATYGGGGPKFYSSIRLKLQNVGKIAPDGAKNPIGNWVEVTVKKNRLDPPGRKCRFPVYYDTGVSDTQSLAEVLRERGVFGPSASWPVWNEQKYHGFRALVAALEEDPALAQEIKAKALELFSRKETENEVVGYDDSETGGGHLEINPGEIGTVTPETAENAIS